MSADRNGPGDSPGRSRHQPDAIVARVNSVLEQHLKCHECKATRLHQALQYAVFNGGKRLRPLLVHAAGRALDISPELLDAPASAVELIHCYSLVHDDLPAMDDDDLRRGRPTLHLAYDEATAILTGDALQALAFQILGEHPALDRAEAARGRMIAILSRACGVDGMAGGQALDLSYEGKQPGIAELEAMYCQKTGALIRAAVTMPCALRPELEQTDGRTLARFGDCIGLAFQIRDDVLDVEGKTEVIGKPQGADQARNKPTWPALRSVEAANQRIDELVDEARSCLDRLGHNTDSLAWLATRMVNREF
ncbi:polyprenyl synthetase family protein [Wenzhouxiangella sp. AB-CW3]|uniref:polyprenyl synthetase family protein n=1 Tax=Wenzhouxiangella sp. AB-CW3 TaxID=2771012 RepID=UPI00168A6D0C|nr:farnesyl diphosphate synthase [Wenzhouxiangella sp. AB-CW3]QOC22974.1 polyprenyl synthetase family protein [Wenzhouxiangella sp. AB-CW3]